LINSFLNRHRIAFRSWVFFSLFICTGGASADDLNIERLNDKSAEIHLMNETVHAKYSQAIDIREQLHDMLDDLEAEIHLERNQRKISDFTEAMRVSRIEYNLELIRKLRAYIVLLDREITYFQGGRQKLEFFNRQIQDDVMIINAVNHMTIDALLHRIDLALREYASAAGDYLMDADEIAPEDLENTWKRVVRK